MEMGKRLRPAGSEIEEDRANTMVKGIRTIARRRDKLPVWLRAEAAGEQSRQACDR